MRASYRAFFWVVLSLALLPVQAAWAQAPMAAIEPINVIVTGSQPIDRFYPNVFDPFHPKDLILDLMVTEIDGPGATGTLFWYFDWIDPTGGIVTTPPSSITIPSGPTVPVHDMFRIPFCPQEVSLHLHSDGTFQVNGTFTHICLPEPSSLALLAIGGLTTLGICWRRRARTA